MYPSIKTNLVVEAVKLVEHYHASHTRWDNSSYVLHLYRVVDRVVESGLVTTEAIVTALLHDIVEDTPFTLAQVESMFGTQIAQNIDCLTQRPEEIRADYFNRCFEQGNHVVYAVKFADRIDNITGLQDCPTHLLQQSYPEVYLYEVRNYFFPAAHKVDTALRNLLFDIYNKITEHFKYGI